MSAETMVGFGPKQTWLAFPAGGPDAVRAALRLRDLGPVAWRAGIDLAYLTDDRVVLTPPLDGGWLLVTGQWLWNADVPSVAELSAALGTEVHRYSTHRGLEQHGWERAVDGELVRAFAYDGRAAEVVRSIGAPEAGFGLDTEDVLVGEADVFRLAGEWSVDPRALDGRPAPGPLLAAAPE